MKGMILPVEQYPFSVTPLPYPYSALEPYIDTETMTIHHNILYAGYVKRLNDALQKLPRWQLFGLEGLIRACGRIPADYQTVIHRNAGGAYNHELFFASMTSYSHYNETSALARSIQNRFGNYDTFVKRFTEAALAVFGSGYAWLGVMPNGALTIQKTANQDTILTCSLTPILLLDCWEHAYFLKYHADRNRYIQAWFSILNWDIAERRYLATRIRTGIKRQIKEPNTNLK